ncbi:MAG: outer membrane protein assembly factor BamE [Betaproteobacteria bacterium]|nr:outer membrane protein assembly factor BamE [Betaproteobacteria bacterium]
MTPFCLLFCRRVVFSAAFLLLSGCAYKSEIRQGSDSLPEKIAELRVGMNKEEVRGLLGQNRFPAFLAEEGAWFYYYRRRSPGFFTETRTWSVKLVFDGEKLSEIVPTKPPENKEE